MVLKRDKADSNIRPTVALQFGDFGKAVICDVPRLLVGQSYGFTQFVSVAQCRVLLVVDTEAISNDMVLLELLRGTDSPTRELCKPRPYLR